MSSRLVTPPGWPAAVRPPEAPDWERTAVAWLLDLCPPDFRAYEVLRRHPVVLARFARMQLRARQLATEEGLAETRVALRDVAAATTVGQALAAWHTEAAQLTGLARGVDLVEEALRGRRFRAKL